MRNKALFLDRDGVINIDHGYVFRIEEFEFVHGIFDVVRAAVAKKYKVVVVTNQAGIARGYYSETDFATLTNWMLDQFASELAPIDKVYFSPFHPTAGIGEYKRDDISRKPRPGMIMQAQKEFEIDLKRSIIIGDKVSDVQAGSSAGVGTKVLFCGNREVVADVSVADHVISDLSETLALFVDEDSEF